MRAASEALGGKGGGGRPDMAQAGGPDGAKADAALEAIEAALARSRGLSRSAATASLRRTRGRVTGGRASATAYRFRANWSPVA